MYAPRTTFPRLPIAFRTKAVYRLSMTQPPLHVLAVVGSLNRTSSTRMVVTQVARELKAAGAATDVLDLLDEPLALFNPDSAHHAEVFAALQARLERADAYSLGSPDSPGS